MDRWRGDAERLLPLWADGETEPARVDAEAPRGAGGPRCGRRAAAGAALALAACALAALGGRSRGAGAGRSGRGVEPRLALDEYEDATVPAAYGGQHQGGEPAYGAAAPPPPRLASGEPSLDAAAKPPGLASGEAADGAAAVPPRLAAGEVQLPSAGYGGSEGELEGGLSATYGDGSPATDEQAEALLQGMLSQPQASQGDVGSAATAGGQAEVNAASEAAAADQWAPLGQGSAAPVAAAGDMESTAEATTSADATKAATPTAAQETVAASTTASAPPAAVAVAADTKPTAEATTSTTAMNNTKAAAPTAAQETVAASTTASAPPAAVAVAADTQPTAEATISTIAVSTTKAATPTTAQKTTTASTTTTLEETTTTTLEECGLVEPGIDYPGNDLRAVKDVLSAELCCSECANEVDCVAWVWGLKRGEAFSDMCFMKGGHPRGQITRVVNPDVVSGQPTQVGRHIPTLNRTSGQSLFCFAVMMPDGYESDLLAFQYENAGGVFGCDDYAIYSNVSTEVAPGCSTLKVDMDLHSEMGGEFGTALNTGVFLSIWQSVVGAGRYKLHDWTVKVDPDSVFFAPRLRLLVQGHKEVAGGVYLNNCQFGLHGPLEVFSTNAVTAWDGAQEKCQKHFWDLCSGDCNWGEDMFIDQCLNYTGVQRDDDFNQLLEDHCDPPEGWDECQDPLVVAFHPFKTVAKQKACIKNAAGSSP